MTVPISRFLTLAVGPDQIASSVHLLTAYSCSDPNDVASSNINIYENLINELVR